MEAILIHSTLYNKNTNEDPKTSTIFEHLLLLPDNILWSLLRNSSRTYKQELPEEIGYLEKFEFWPKWDPNNTSNSTYVEPDIFIRYNLIDIIVEAKYQDGAGQYQEEWLREIQAYYNEYSSDKKQVVLLSVGGNSDYKAEIINSCKILKINWSDLLDSVIKLKASYHKAALSYEKSSLIRLLDLTIEGFHIMGEKEYKKKTDLSAINSIYTLTKMFDEVCNKRETADYTLTKYSESSAASHYVYNFGVNIKKYPNKTIYLGLGIWYQYGELAIQMNPTAGWAKSLVDFIVSGKKLTEKYLSEPFSDYDGKWYIDTNNQFCDDFSKAESYDMQLEVLKGFVDELIENYLKYI